MPGEDIVRFGSRALAHAWVLNEALHGLVAVKLGVCLEPQLAQVLYLGFGNVKVHYLSVRGCRLFCLSFGLLFWCTCEECRKVAIAVLLQLLALFLGESHVARTCVQLRAESLQESHAVVVALLHCLGVLDRAQPCDNPRSGLYHVLCLETEHHRHVVCPHVHCIAITINPFGNGEDCTLGNGGRGKFSCTDTHLTCRVRCCLYPFVSHIAQQRRHRTRYRAKQCAVQGRFQHVACGISLVLTCLLVDVSAMQPLAFALLDALVCAKVPGTSCHTSHDTPGQRIAKQTCAHIGGCFLCNNASSYVECRLTCKRADTTRYISGRVEHHACHRTANLRPTVVLAVVAHRLLVCGHVACRSSLAPCQSLVDSA